jgi:hypothetical protein
LCCIKQGTKAGIATLTGSSSPGSIENKLAKYDDILIFLTNVSKQIANLAFRQLFTLLKMHFSMDKL